jgi:hypothetical protein
VTSPTLLPEHLFSSLRVGAACAFFFLAACELEVARTVDARPLSEDASAESDAGPIDGGVVAAFYELRHDPAATPRLSVVDDEGEPATELSPAALAVIDETEWELVVPTGETTVVVREGSVTVGDVVLSIEHCYRLEYTLVTCAGDPACWSTAASAPPGNLPAGAPALSCRPTVAGDACEPLAVPSAGVVVAPVAIGIDVFEAGAQTISLRELPHMVQLDVRDAAAQQSVYLLVDGTVEERYPESTVDWRAGLARVRASLGAIVSWSYQRSTCTREVVDPSCSAAETVLEACLAAYLDGTGASTCTQMLAPFLDATAGNPVELAAYCTGG